MQSSGKFSIQSSASAHPQLASCYSSPILKIAVVLHVLYKRNCCVAECLHYLNMFCISAPAFFKVAWCAQPVWCEFWGGYSLPVSGGSRW